MILRGERNCVAPTLCISIRIRLKKSFSFFTAQLSFETALQCCLGLLSRRAAKTTARSRVLRIGTRRLIANCVHQPPRSSVRAAVQRADSCPTPEARCYHLGQPATRYRCCSNVCTFLLDRIKHQALRTPNLCHVTHRSCCRYQKLSRRS